MEVAWVFLGVLLAAGIVAWLVYGSMPGGLVFESTLPPSEILEGAVTVFTSQGWTPTSRTPTQVTFVRESRPSCCLALVLALIFIVPAILYMILWRETHTASVGVSRRGNTSRVQVVWNRRSAAQGAALRFRDITWEIEEEA